MSPFLLQLKERGREAAEEQEEEEGRNECRSPCSRRSRLAPGQQAALIKNHNHSATARTDGQSGAASPTDVLWSMYFAHAWNNNALTRAQRDTGWRMRMEGGKEDLASGYATNVSFLCRIVRL